MLIGYARTSTADQRAGLDAQLRDLDSAGCDKVFAERISSVAVQRPQLAECLAYLRPGDTLVVTRLDRLARSIRHLLEIVEALERRDVGLRILSLGVDTGTPSGRLVLTMLGAIAEFERSLMLERQREGIAKARAEGKYRGRAPTAKRQAAAILALRAQGAGVAEIARTLGIGRSSVYRVLGDVAGAPRPELCAGDRVEKRSKEDREKAVRRSARCDPLEAICAGCAGCRRGAGLTPHRRDHPSSAAAYAGIARSSAVRGTAPRPARRTRPASPSARRLARAAPSSGW